MSNLGLIFSGIVGILGFLFFFWRRLKEDYTSTQIFSFAFIVLTFMLSGLFIGLGLYNFSHTNYFSSQGVWFWGAVIGTIVGFEIGYLKFKLRFFETLEATGISFIFFILTIFLGSSLKQINVKYLAVSLFLGFLIVLFYFLEARYKKFTWYKSGKIGFSGLMVLGIFFLMRSVVALIDPSMLSFIGKFDAIADSIAAFLFFLSIYNLSGL